MESTSDKTGTALDPLGEGPYLLSAVLCERVMVEQDGVKTAFRIIDRITQAKVGPDPPEEMPPFAASLSLLIKLKAGMCSGQHYLKVHLQTPQGIVHTPLTQALAFEGTEQDQGVDFVGTLQVRFDREGIYWFDVVLDDIRLTRIPVRIIYQRRVQQVASGQGGQSMRVQ